MPDSATPRSSPRSTTEILKDVFGNIENLIRFEIRLAKLEFQGEAKQAGFAIGALVAGGIVALYGVAFLLVSLYIGLSHAIRPWLSALLIGGVLVLLGGAVARNGFRKLREMRPRAGRRG
jgi:membrane protein